MVVMTPREKWTDERLDDLNEKVDNGFAQLHSDLQAVRSEVNHQVTALRTVVDARFDTFNERLESFYRVLIGAAGMVIAALIGLIGVNTF